MKILLIGANSYVGARLYWDLVKSYDVIGTYAHNQLSKALIQLDITDSRAVNTLISSMHPDVVVHCANNADGRWCEAHPKEAVALNQISTQTVVDVANNTGAKVVYISSFAVFAPNNVYAKTKYQSEKIVEKTDAGYLILRPSFILGFSPNMTNDRPFNRLLKNLDQKTPAIYDTSWKFQATYVGHISEVILACMDRTIWNRTIPVTVSGLKTRFQIARDILTPFGVKVTPEVRQDKLPILVDDLKVLKDLVLPQYTYEQMIDRIIDEIKHRETFVI